MSPDARAAILDSLAAGVPLARALRSAGVTPRALDLARATDPELDAACSAAARVAPAPTWAEVVTSEASARPPRKASPARDRDEIEPGPRAQSAEAADRVAQIRHEARSLHPDTNMAHLLWVERHRVDFGLHALDPQWLYHFEEFYVSDKFLDVGRWGVRAAKSDSVCAAITAESLLMPRKLEPSIKGTCAVLSSNTREAGDRFETIKQNLMACGLANITGTRREIDDASFKVSGGGSAPLLIELFDFGGAEIRFQIFAITETSSAGFTAIAGFGDELDLWGKSDGAKPAEKVVEMVITRFTTVPQAKLHLMSATYDRDSYHARLIKNGDTPRQRVARLGAAGSAKDYEARMRLAEAIKSADPVLIAPPLPPESTDIPCWVSNPIAPIDECYRKMDGDLARMFAKYGGRLSLAGSSSSVTVADLDAIASFNREPAPSRSHGMRSDGLLHVPGYDHAGRPGALPSRYRGL